MFWSKIGFFVVGTVAAASLGVALTMPRPAARKLLASEDERLNRARWVVEVLLRENARQRVDLAMFAARLTNPTVPARQQLDAILDEAGKGDRISPESHQAARGSIEFVLRQFSGAEKPEIVIATDAWGRVVARAGVDEKEWGDDISGYFLVRDALRGYMRDDLWLVGGKLYRMAAAPVIDHSLNDKYVGAVILGDEIDFPLAKGLEERVSSHCTEPAADGSRTCDTHVAFFARGNVVAASESSPITEDIKEAYAKHREALDRKNEKGRSIPLEPITVTAAKRGYRVALRRLPGEVGAQDGFFAVFSKRPDDIGFFGTLGRVVGSDIAFKNFPWLLLGGGFLLVVVGGLALLWWENDRPLRRLVEDAIALGKGDRTKLEEELHRGKYGSIARSVNLALDKLTRESKTQKRDLGALLGGLDDALGTGARPLPAQPPGGSRGAFTPPGCWHFSRGPRVDGGPAVPSIPHGGGFEFEIPPPPPPAAAPPPPPPRSSAPPPMPVAAARPATPPVPPPAPPPLPRAAPPPPLPSKLAASPPRATGAVIPPPLSALEDDILGGDEDVLASLSSGASVTEPTSPRRGGASDFGQPTVVADPSEDLLRESAADPGSAGEESYFRQVFAEFVELKRKCGENTDGLTFEKFSGKLRLNRDQLISKYNCKSVRFQVYVKDGKAALKATPVRT